MKNLMFCLLLGIASLYEVSAQSQFYGYTFTLGVSPKQTPLQADLFVNREDPLNELIFNLTEIKSYYEAGLTRNIRLSDPFFCTFGLKYSLQKEQYDYTYTYKELIAGIPQQLSVSSHILTLPAGVGVKFKNLDVTSGLQLQYAVKSDMKDSYPSGIEMTPSRLHMGWYSGIGYSFDRTRIGIQYQSAMNRYGDNLKNGGQSLALRCVPSNVMFTIGFSF
jgi:hypothetical protein